jgi:hypothetical protein
MIICSEFERVRNGEFQGTFQVYYQSICLKEMKEANTCRPLSQYN